MTLPRTVLLVLLALACAGLGVGVVVLSERGPATARDPAPVGAPVTDGPVAVLREWDRRRAAAWATGDVRRLRSLYVRGSRAAAADVGRLQRWESRGVRVSAIDTQLLRVRVVSADAHRTVLAVTDRVARVETTDRRSLPDDRESSWRIVLRRIRGEWLVASVTR